MYCGQRLSPPAAAAQRSTDTFLPAASGEPFSPEPAGRLPTCAYVLVCATRCAPSAARSTTQQRWVLPTRCAYASAQLSTAAVTSRLRAFFTSEGSCFMRAAGVPGLWEGGMGVGVGCWGDRVRG